MAKVTKTSAEAEKIAKSWAASGMPQADYAAANGIAERTLRQWLQRYAPAPTVAAARGVVEDAMAKLSAILKAFDDHDAACRSAFVSPMLDGLLPAGMPHQEPQASGAEAEITVPSETGMPAVAVADQCPVPAMEPRRPPSLVPEIRFKSGNRFFYAK